MSREAYSREEIEGKKREIIESDDDKNCPKPPLPELGEHSNYIFISYPHKDYKQVYCDLWDYYAEGVRYWYDRGLTAGVDWEKEVRQKITDARCSGIVYYLSENSFTDSMAFEIGCAQEVAPDDSHGKSGRNYFSINLGGRQVMDLLFESQKKGLIKTSQDKVAIIFSTFSEKRTFIGRSKDPSDNKHMSAVIEQFRDRFSVVDSVESEVPKRGAAPESETFDIKKRQNGSYAVVALKDKSEMTVFVPEGVEDIGEGAFEGSDVIEVTLPEGLIKIGKRAFADCESLEKINFPSTLRIISDEAFSGCTSLDVDSPENIKVGTDAFKGTLWEKEEQRKREYTEGLTFKLNDKEDGYVVSGYEGGSESVIIPEIYDDLPVVSIGEGAFNGCVNVESITIPDSVIDICNLAFNGCLSLESITIPEGVTSIGDGAFNFCGIESIEIPSNVNKLGMPIFSLCENLTSVTVSEKNKIYHSSGNCIIKTANKKLVAGCQGCVIPDDGSVTSIEVMALFAQIQIESIVIPKDVKAIGGAAFSGCENLESINVSRENRIYHSEGNCLIETQSKTLIAGFKNSIIPDDGSVAIIGDAAFFCCERLTNIVIPSGVTQIGVRAFSGCSSLESITIPNSVTSIGQCAFENNCDGFLSSMKSALGEDTPEIYDIKIPDDIKITYLGTKQMWRNIEKDRKWDSNMLPCAIHCTDGDIIINSIG